MKTLYLLSALLFTAAIAGCTTTAGPFVTNVSRDANGDLVVEKSNVRYNSFSGKVSEEGTSVTTVPAARTAVPPANATRPAVPPPNDTSNRVEVVPPQ